ncbi:predicted protein [Histoplasma capsulatum G186AR]|uniref:Uncharacterized protein n=1 Tax=Ajellomyces capsulatus (strain G186AR / H82 / ATCC MYA-2454 / RMSCC 2432) TaxID=447093 RepID=C0NPU3_AJECG|nr:uncharacterized protein HCBG_05173 [Histoplasma capsulatum G186AR]EEH06953.1 predicted protein [Histoplasma capsulatum G186AR]
MASTTRHGDTEMDGHRELSRWLAARSRSLGAIEAPRQRGDSGREKREARLRSRQGAMAKLVRGEERRWANELTTAAARVIAGVTFTQLPGTLQGGFHVET